MSVNKNRPHLFILPEDDANRQLANGFHLEVNHARQMQVLPVAGGWRNVLHLFQSEHVAEMERHQARFMLLLLDFDGQENRLAEVKAMIPDHLKKRVFILGAWNEPEVLKASLGLGSYEKIGQSLARIAGTKLTQPGGTSSFNIMQASLLAYARMSAQSYSRPIERGFLDV